MTIFFNIFIMVLLCSNNLFNFTLIFMDVGYFVHFTITYLLFGLR